MCKYVLAHLDLLLIRAGSPCWSGVVFGNCSELQTGLCQAVLNSYYFYIYESSCICI